MAPAIVSTEWLADHLDEPDLRIIDIRGRTLAPDGDDTPLLDHYVDYTERHIPNARFIKWAEDITDDPQHKRVAPVAKYAGAMGKVGIDNSHFVVAYDNASNALAARLWWTLRYYGHTQVAVLDGGWQKWIDEGRVTTADMPQIETTTFEAKPHPELLRQGDDILGLLESTTRLIDMRLPQEYVGERSLTRLSGHIPGAANLPVDRLVGPDNTLLPPKQLREELATAGVDETAPEVIFYSNVGVLSCLGILAMHVAELPSVASNYDASWQEWGNDERKPVV
jgi:thiosulfate/3-mercaptopyruvate sulfurtransferase